jgi:type II secretory pathway component PulF
MIQTHQERPTHSGKSLTPAPSTPSTQHEVSALRTLIFSIISTTGSLMWTLVLLLLIFYCFSVAWYERLESARGMIGVCVYVYYI